MLCRLCAVVGTHTHIWWCHYFNDIGIIALQEVESNQTPGDRKPTAGNVSPASLANGNKQSNGYDSPRIGRRFEAIFEL